MSYYPWLTANIVSFAIRNLKNHWVNLSWLFVVTIRSPLLLLFEFSVASACLFVTFSNSRKSNSLDYRRTRLHFRHSENDITFSLSPVAGQSRKGKQILVELHMYKVSLGCLPSQLAERAHSKEQIDVIRNKGYMRQEDITLTRPFL